MWTVQLLDLILIFVIYRFTALCSYQLLRKAAAELDHRCDPYPLLQETETLLSYPHKKGAELALLINRAVALDALGDRRKAYEILTSIDIEQYNLSPTVRFTYYNNLLGCYLDLEMFEQAERMIPEVMQLYAEIENEKQKQALEQFLWSIRVSEHMLRQEYALALKILTGMKHTCLRTEVNDALLCAKVYLALDETEQAKEKLRFVIAHGNKLYFVTEANQLLESCTKQEVEKG